MQIRNILVFPCGTEIAQEIHAALKYEKTVKLFGASSIEDHGRMVFENYCGDIPFVTAANFNDKFQQYLTDNAIDYILPAHDSVLVYLVNNQEKFTAKIIASSAATCTICRSKQQTYNALSTSDFVPKTYKSVDDISEFPVFLKPDQGQGSQGVQLIHDPASCIKALKADPTLIVCEYLPGKEYTVDCYSTKTNELLFAGARERIRTKAGISVHSTSIPMTDEFNEIAEFINNTLNMQGMWFFQVKYASNGKLKLLEVAPRIAGTMALHRVKGINFVLLALFEAQNLPISILQAVPNATVERALINRYIMPISYKTAYIDLDDTLIVHNKLNQHAVQFIYQCQEKAVSVILITRHIKDPRITLQQFKLHEALFDDIILITDKRLKSDYMLDNSTAIFFDDSFQERLDVTKKGIPSFGPDSFEAFIDYRK